MKGASLLVPIAKRLEGKVALITGGGSGIGESTARLFARHGAKVMIADVQDQLGQSICEDIKSDQNHTVSYIHCDVTSEADVKNAVDSAVKNYGKLDVMFSNAGILGSSDPRISTFDYDNFKRVFDVNVYGSFLAAKHAARVMTPARRGSILFTASAVSVSYGMACHVYTASKNAIVGLAKNLGVELGQYGIRINCISPFGVATPLAREGLQGLDVEKFEEMISASANLIGPVLKADDIAEAALYLASDESKYVSGMNLVVDGGYSTTNVSLKMTMKRFLP
ncbi:secoisolariciresinol dehydrogenase-like [Punica granatum]|uniref:Secoisolariciresinol dehydrogenase-like n=1 Tax=Punica granatum TaxID=22663 RepID=A0A218XIK3_PUNGR|nr:secoisolariciresinol dehydrogenase-like [Punica granatum]OWM84767.1 hypothetical protein CDL15_Pgr027554 [Punica granatum]